MLTCPACGMEHPDGARFCMNCATALAAASPMAEERKVVTTLICDLVAFTAMSEAADPEDIDNLLGKYSERARKVIESHGGTVEKFIGDAVVGVFGVPTVHEDDPERAVRAGLRLIEALEDLTRPDGAPLEARVGVNTGEALVRLDVDPASGRGFLTGDAVNVAARLQAAAPPGGVAVGALTHELTSRVIEYDELPAIAAKGKAEPVAAWLAKAPVSRLGMEVDRDKLTPFVGRELELSYLRALSDKAVSTSSPQFALIVGEPGIGKSRLVQELFAYVDSHPEMTTWRQGRCLSYGEGITFWALAEIVKAQAGILETDDVEIVAAKLDAVVPEGADRAWLANRLRALVGLEAPQAEREENFTAWLRFVESLAVDEPLVVVLEDLHWADDGLLAFVEHLATHADAVPLLLVGTARPELFEHHPTFAAGGAQVNRISLGPLASEDSQRLVACLLGDTDTPIQKVTDIVERSEGNPFFAEESARLLLDRASEAQVPASVQAVVAARLDALPGEQKAVLADAAVVGEVFWDGAVAALDHGEREAVDVTLRELVGRRLVRRIRDSSMAGEGEFAFAHSLARDVAYGALPRRVRAKRHAKVAAWLERKVGGDVREESELLVHHRLAALELARAVGDGELVDQYRAPAVAALRLAGERAMRLDVETAEGLLSRAVELCASEDAQRADVLRAWGRTLALRGRYGDAKGVLEESVERFLRDARRGEAATTLVDLEETLQNQGDQEWTAVLDRALELTDDEADSEARALVMTAMAGARTAQCDYATGLEWANGAAEIYRRKGTKVPAEVQWWRAQAQCGLGQRGAADTLLAALRVFRDEGMGRQAVFAYLNTGISLFPFEGPRAYDIAEEGLEFLCGLGVSGGVSYLENNRSWGRYLAGRLDEALAIVDTALEVGNEDYLMAAWDTKAQILVAMGRGAEALHYAELADRGARAMGERALALGSGATLVMALSAIGEKERATELLEGIATAPAFPGYQGYEESIPNLIRCALKLGESALAGQLLARVSPGMPLMDHVIAIGRALLDESQAEYETAQAGFSEAALAWHDFGVPYEEAQALLGRGRCLVALGKDDGAREPLTGAREIFESLGAKPALIETEALLARAGVVPEVEA